MPTALEVGGWFLASIDRGAGDAITHLKLQKLVYYAQAWSLALRNTELFAEDMRAWAHGPVAKTVWDAYRDYGWEALPAPEATPDFDEDTVEFLAEILRVYGDFSAKHLEEMTHNERPWLQARGNLPPEARSNAIIQKASMAEFYQQVYKADNGRQV